MQRISNPAPGVDLSLSLKMEVLELWTLNISKPSELSAMRFARMLYHPTAIHYRINSPNPHTGKNHRN
eukprot:1703314-Amphidinium_carterae.1